MDLKQAANYFNRTRIDGWDGAAWSLGETYGRLMVSERSREASRWRDLLVDPDYPITSPVVRLNGTSLAYLVGTAAIEYDTDPYNLYYPIYLANATAAVRRHTQTAAISGLSTVTATSTLATFYCGYDRVESQKSMEFKEARFSELQIYLPSNCIATVDDELLIDGTLKTEIKEVYLENGLVVCRGVAKR